MYLTKWDPFETMNDLQEDIGHFFNRRFSVANQAQTKAWLPYVDIHENEEAITFEVDAPGIDKNNLNISLENNVLTIKGQRQNSSETKGKRYHRIEREYGTFTRSFSLPDTADSEKVNAEYRDGVLHVMIAKKAAAKAKKIDVKVG
jgi:HSP20 family protein